MLTSETNPSVTTAIGFTGVFFDISTGLNYHRARWLDLATGRWMSEDPIGFAGGDTNLTRDVGNSPIAFTDPEGLWEFPILLTSGWEFKGLLQRLREMAILDRNTEHLPEPQRTYTRVAFPIANEVGVRGVSDSCSKHDALDAHEQSVTERVYDGATGSVQLVGTAVGTQQVSGLGRGLGPNIRFPRFGGPKGAPPAPEAPAVPKPTTTQTPPTKPTEIGIPKSAYPEAAEHISDAQAAGHPRELTIDRPGAPVRRPEALAGHKKVPGKHLDEYPPAMCKEGGAGASVRPISPADNMGAGAHMGNKTRHLPDGSKIIIKVIE